MCKPVKDWKDIAFAAGAGHHLGVEYCHFWLRSLDMNLKFDDDGDDQKPSNYCAPLWWFVGGLAAFAGGEFIWLLCLSE